MELVVVKKKYNMKPLMLLMIAGLFITIGCNKSVSYEEAFTKNENQFDDRAKLEDAKFLVDVNSRNLLVIQLLTSASDSGYSSVVVNFAKENLAAHQQLDEEIGDLAKKKDISLADELSPEHQLMLNQLSAARRQDFDNVFSRIISRINEENNSLFTTKATQASDADVRAFAARKLDLLRAHSQSIAAMQSQLLDTSQ